MRYIFFYLSFLLSQWINRRRTPNPEGIESILIIKLDHIGDVLTALPAIVSIRNHFPRAKITIMAGTWCGQLLKNHPAVDEIVLYNAPRYVRSRKNRQSLAKRWAILNQLCNRPFDLVIGLQENWATLFMTLKMKPRWRIDRGSYALRRKAADASVQAATEKFGLSTFHEVNANLGIISLFMIPTAFSFPLVLISNDARTGAKKILQRVGLDEQEFVILHPGATWNYRRWQRDNFAVLADKIIEELHTPVLFTGDGEDSAFVDSIRGHMVHRSDSAVNEISLEEFAAVVDKSCLMVANDGGAVHIASALNRPVIALFGPENPEIFGPWSFASMAIKKTVVCSPCRQVSCVRPHRSCVGEIEVHEVFQAVKKQISAKNDFRTEAACIQHHA